MKIFKRPNNDTYKALEPLYEVDVEITAGELAQIISDRIAANIPPPPSVVSMRQARLALLRAGKLQQVNNAIASMQGMEGEAARIEWDYSNEVRRNQPLTIALAHAIGMTEAEMDALFVEAAKL